MTVRLWGWNDDPAPLHEHIAQGGVIALPTESSYGLGCDPRSSAGVETILEIKRRPAWKAMPVVVAELRQLGEFGIDLDSPGLRQVATHWPAALGLVVKLDTPIPAAAGLPDLAVRVPGHPRLRRLLEVLGHGLTATSANRSGDAPILAVEELTGLLEGHNVWVVDDGPQPGGPPSTLVRWTSDGFDLLREGRVPFQLLAQASACSQGRCK